mmetsp:Transcript_39616/g.69194  ORF Transcript_39616/g.69194 Transcript_39616/m.69194 type:complete len:462 (-) Transcript_39616:376-1761(-)
MLLRWNIGRVDVIDAWTDLVGVLEAVESIQQLHVRARGLNRDDVGVHVGDGRDDVVELRVAHVGVDLGLVTHAVGSDAEGFDGPVQVLLPLRLAQRQALAQRGLVDLDHANTGLLKVQYLLADGQRELLARRRARLVVAHEGPVQYRHRAGQHALHGLLGERLGIGDPLHRHRLRAADVAEQDRRLDAARAVGLHPTELAEGVAVELLPEVFDHVVTLGLAVHQHVQFQLFLLAHAALDLGPHRGLVAQVVQAAGLKFAARVADFGGLREGADSGCRVRRQLEESRLLGRTIGVGAFALAHVDVDAGYRGLHRRVVHARRGAAGSQRSLVGCQRVLDRSSAFAQGLAEHAQFFELLQREGQPGLDLGVQLLLAREVHWHMQQRARRRDPQALTQPLDQRLDPVEHGRQVGLPDIATIDDAQRQHLVSRQKVDQGLHALTVVDGINVQSSYRQAGREVGVFL